MDPKLRPVTERSEAKWAWEVEWACRRQQLIEIGMYPPELELTIVKEWAELPEEVRQKLHSRNERITKEYEALLR